MEDTLVGILTVPRQQARSWLRGSGCGGAYLRPFWTEQTAKEVQRDQFTLLWARGRRGAGPELWKALHDQPGIFRLLLGGRDVAVRVTAEADITALQAKLRFALNEQTAEFRRPVPGER